MKPKTPQHTPWMIDVIAHATDEMARTGKENERAIYVLRAVNAYENHIRFLEHVSDQEANANSLAIEAKKLLAEAKGK